jgi:hypothetical protein
MSYPPFGGQAMRDELRRQRLSYPSVDTPDLGRVFQAVRDGNCIPFFGAGASMGYAFNGSSALGIPSGWQLTMDLLREAGVAKDSQVKAPNDPDGADLAGLKDAIKIFGYDCFLFRKNNDRGELDRFLRKRVSLAADPRPIHTVIAQLKDIFVIGVRVRQISRVALNAY